MIVFSNFNNAVLLHSMFVDCCMLEGQELGSMAAVIQQGPPLLIKVQNCLPLRRRHHTSFPHDVLVWTTRHNGQLGKETAKLRALIPAGMLFLTLLPVAKIGTGKNWEFFTLLRKLLAKSSCIPPPTMASAGYHSGIPALPAMPSPDRNDSEWSWLIVVCLGGGWGAPKRPWDDGGRHG